MEKEKIKLTQFSHGSGCGCKIAPQVLEEILSNSKTKIDSKNLLVGNENGDDAAVWDLGNGNVLISTADFFTPIVDDAFTFGKIAAANAISDVFAMGGNPIFALAILGWPVEKLPTELANEVMRGAKEICDEAKIPIAGGHTIDSPEPIFGLAVNGISPVKNLKKNSSAKVGDVLFLTKKIGTGILATALKRNLISENEMQSAVDSMSKLNAVGKIFGEKDFVHAMTDVTGFGLLGHLIEMCEGSNLTAEIDYKNVQLIEGAKELVAKFIYPDNTMRNWKSFENKTKGISGESLLTLCDPQTNGGLLVAVDSEKQNEFEKILQENNLLEFVIPIGKMKNKSEFTLEILN